MQHGNTPSQAGLRPLENRVAVPDGAGGGTHQALDSLIPECHEINDLSYDGVHTGDVRVARPEAATQTRLGTSAKDDAADDAIECRLPGIDRAWVLVCKFIRTGMPQ